jgi:hypothetical protein
LRQEFPKWWAMLPEIPSLVHENLRHAGEIEAEKAARAKQQEQLQRQLRQNHRKLYFAIAGSGILVTGALILGMEVQVFDGSAWGSAFGWVITVVGGLFLVRGWPDQNP